MSNAHNSFDTGCGPLDRDADDWGRRGQNDQTSAPLASFWKKNCDVSAQNVTTSARSSVSRAIRAARVGGASRPRAARGVWEVSELTKL